MPYLILKKLNMSIQILLLGLYFFLFSSYPLSSFGESAVLNKKTLHVYVQSTSAYPWVMDTSVVARNTFNAAILGQLLYLNRSYVQKPGLLSEAHWDYVNNYYVLHLKPDLYFQNGRKVTIEDLEFSLLRFLFSSKPTNASMFLINIKGSENIKHGQKYSSSLVKGLKILDKNTLAVSVKHPNPMFLYNIASAFFPLVPREELQDNLIDWKKWPIGAGAYKIVDQDIVNKVYHLELVNKKENKYAPTFISFELNRSLKPDLCYNDPISSKSDSYINKELVDPYNSNFITFNFNSELGNNPDFRRAINLALSRKEISEKSSITSYPLYEIVPPIQMGRIFVKETNDIEEAKNLFKKVLGKNINKVFKIRILDSDKYGDEYIKIVQNQLALAGLKIEYLKSSNVWNPFQGELSDSPFCFSGFSNSFYDPLLHFALLHKGSPAIHQYPNDDNLESLFNQAMAAPSFDVLTLSIHKLSHYFLENNIVIPLMWQPSIVYYNSTIIKSIGEQPGGTTLYLNNIELK